MRRLAIISASAIAPMISAADAAVTVVYDFQSALTAGTNGADSTMVGPDFPDGGAIQIDDFNSSEGNPDAYASATGFGTGDNDGEPISFAAGATVTGEASSLVSLTALITITNDTGAAADASFNSLIFGGGVGVATAAFANNCSLQAIWQCGDYAPGGPDQLQHAAALDFGLSVVDGDSLFDGQVIVGPGGNSAEFNGIALDDFGLSDSNENFFTWDDTQLTDVSLGTLAAGESITLEFSISLFVLSLFGPDTTDCELTDDACSFATAGFGDPWEDTGGVILFSASPPGVPYSFTAELTPSEVPVPPAALLFPLGVATLAARRKMQRR